jgi:hypothetical protein
MFHEVLTDAITAVGFRAFDNGKRRFNAIWGILSTNVMDWLKYCGISDEMMNECIELKKDGFI